MRSMTGYAKVAKKLKNLQLECEIKSLNHRFLHTRLNLHPEVERYDFVIDKIIRDTIKRGYLILSINIHQSENKSLLFTPQKIRQIQTEIEPLMKKLGTKMLFTLDDFINLQQKLDIKPPIPQAQISGIVQEALKKLIKSRKIEGKHIYQIFKKKLIALKSCVDQIEKIYPAIISANRQKINELLGNTSRDDYQMIKSELHQLVDKSLVTEEIDRIKFHLDKLQQTIPKNNLMGKQITFILQELSREINTLSAKALNGEIQYSCVKMRETLEELREQSENIE